MAGQRRRRGARPLPPETIPVPPASEDTDPDEGADEPAPAPSVRQLRDGQLVPLAGVRHLRLLITAASGDGVEIDPVALMLTEQCLVRSDADMVFFGQPDHASGAVSLAADDTGAVTALHVTPEDLPPDVIEVLLTSQLTSEWAPQGRRTWTSSTSTQDGRSGNSRCPCPARPGSSNSALHRTTGSLQSPRPPGSSTNRCCSAFATSNVPVGVVPIVMLDMWEHAFYLQYKNVKPDCSRPRPGTTKSAGLLARAEQGTVQVGAWPGLAVLQERRGRTGHRPRRGGRARCSSWAGAASSLRSGRRPSASTSRAVRSSTRRTASSMLMRPSSATSTAAQGLPGCDVARPATGAPTAGHFPR
jgi:hypothetical protein